MFLLVIAMKYAAHTCIHEELQSKKKPDEAEVDLESDFKEIRINYDLKYVNNANNDDTLKCTKENGKITWNNTEYICSAEDVINESKKEVLTSTLTEISNQLKRFIKVKHVTTQYSLKNYDNLKDIKESDKSETDKDLHISVLSRPFGDLETAAATVIVQIHKKTKQPLQAVMFINVKKIPQYKETRYTHILLHETLHALGVSSSMFNYYHPVNSNTPHENITCVANVHDYQSTYLITPNAHKFALIHYGYEKVGNCQSGIELDNSEGIQKSHPEFRRYYTDMLTGIILETSNSSLYRLSDVSLAILRDTGFYDVSHTGFKPIIWYNPLAITGERNTSFSENIPNNVYPENYILTNRNDHAMFDFNGVGNFSYYDGDQWKATSDCGNESGPDSEYCQHSEFYNPVGYTTIFNEKLVDYTNIKIPIYECPTGKAAIPTTKYLDLDSKGLCGNYSCTDDNSQFTFNAPDGKQITCKTGDNHSLIVHSYQHSVGGRTFKYDYFCPDPKQFCLTRKLLGQSSFDTDPFASNPPPIPRPSPSPKGGGGSSSGSGGDTSPNSKSFNWQLFVIIMIILDVVVFVIGIIALAILYRKKKDEKAEEEDSYSEYMYSSDSI